MLPSERACEFRQRRVYAWPFLFEELQTPGIVEAMSKCLYFTTRTMEKFPKIKRKKPVPTKKEEEKKEDGDEETKVKEEEKTEGLCLVVGWNR